MTSQVDKLAGKFIVIDGPDGAGKSSQAQLLAEHIRSQGLTVCEVRDPGGTAIGDRIRQILLDRDHDDMSVQCELMLYMASRAQLVHELVRPALNRGECVLSDRYISSTVAYQGAGGADVDAVAQAGQIAVGDAMPDLTMVLDIESEKGLARALRVGQADRIESKAIEYHRRVREIFLSQAQNAPHSFAVISAEGDINQVQQEIRDVIAAWNW